MNKSVVTFIRRDLEGNSTSFQYLSISEVHYVLIAIEEAFKNGTQLSIVESHKDVATEEERLSFYMIPPIILQSYTIMVQDISE